VTVPLFVLNQVSDERCEWLVPGMLKDKIQACSRACRSARARALCRCPTTPPAGRSCSPPEAFGHGSLTGRAAEAGARRDQLDVKRGDFKLDMLSPPPVHELPRGGRARPPAGHGRNLGALKAELGAQARGAFQALAG
jgi:ATP-dependent helicase HrpA